jgi:hypothetical protein
MPGDIQRLFSLINQADLPYRVFEDRAAAGGEKPVLQSAPQVQREPQVIERRVPANEDVESAHAGLFRAYNVEAALSASQGRPLAGIFRRMANR